MEVEVVPVSSPAEERRRVADLRCPACGGMWEVEGQTLLEGGVDVLALRCRSCAETREAYFDVSAFLESGPALPGNSS